MEYNNEIIKNISFDFKNREKVRLSCTEGLKYRISHTQTKLVFTIQENANADRRLPICHCMR